MPTSTSSSGLSIVLPTETSDEVLPPGVTIPVATDEIPTTTLTTTPPSFTTIMYTNSQWSKNTWLTTTAKDGSPTTVPLIRCKKCAPDPSIIISYVIYQHCIEDQGTNFRG